jgi:hypothetical protein
MSLLDRLQYNNINHAVVHNEEWGMSDWFVICNKQQLRNINIIVHGSYFHNSDELYLINLRKHDVHTFYEMCSFGYYELAYRSLTGTVYELKDNGFRKYINRKPVRKTKIKIWIK